MAKLRKTYKVKFEKCAADFIRSADRKVQRQLINRATSLAQNPFPKGCTKIKGAKEVYRIRSGIYRISYQVKNNELIILVARIGHRKDFYRFYG